MRIVISSRDYRVEDGTLALGGISVSIKDGSAEAPIEGPDAFWAVLRDFAVVRLRDGARFRVSWFDAGWLNIAAEDLAAGAVSLPVAPEAGAVRISVPAKNARVFLVNAETSRDFQTDESGALVPFFDLNRYRVAVPAHSEADVRVEAL